MALETDFSVCYSAQYLPDCEQVIVYRDGYKPVLINFHNLIRLRILCHRAGFTAGVTDQIVRDVKLCRDAMVDRESPEEVEPNAEASAAPRADWGFFVVLALGVAALAWTLQRA